MPDVVWLAGPAVKLAALAEAHGWEARVRVVRCPEGHDWAGRMHTALEARRGEQRVRGTWLTSPSKGAQYQARTAYAGRGPMTRVTFGDLRRSILSAADERVGE